MNNFTFNEVLRLSAPRHVDVVYVLKFSTTHVAHLVISVCLYFVAVNAADFETTTANTAFVSNNAHKNGVTANHFLDAVKCNFFAFRVNEVLFD